MKAVEYMQALDRPVYRREVSGMPVAQHLLEILRCPKSLGELIYVASDAEEFLFCPQSKLKYRVDDGIPVLLIDEAESLDDASCEALLAAHAKS